MPNDVISKVEDCDRSLINDSAVTLSEILVVEAS